MNSLTNIIDVQVPENLYIKNPRESRVGKDILAHGAAMIAKCGIEAFNFLKLASECQCTEATIYRYFENKHKLLLYYLNLFWGWQEYFMVMRTHSVEEPGKRLKEVVSVLSHPEIPSNTDPAYGANIVEIATSEGVKIHLSREVGAEITDGSMFVYYRLLKRISKFISDKKPKHKYPDTLAITIIDAALQTKFYQDRYPGLAVNIHNAKSSGDFLFSLIPD